MSRIAKLVRTLKKYLLRQIFLLILSPFRSRNICPGAGMKKLEIKRLKRNIAELGGAFAAGAEVASAKGDSIYG